ncbi:FAD:protein FMN transferase [Psychromarinibacter sp. C21-152]|uniref:FAD:protein FMN transferase n=1 Tax=Psychromarinibacter sediminicola TaxID=3033385 RepID=A0AAE3NSY1_9RHOB|nr:FAD:protein FMN transferase [Psychromarinibacter sediminicola]MDF0601864.1 FAD:protein FMN transferase [Psychromarinibacter sediminicola]
MRLTRRRLLTATAATLAAPRLALGASPVETLDGAAFGTGWRVVLPAGAGAARLRAPLKALLAEIDAEQSPWRPDSLITAFNRAPAGPVEATPETARVAAAALALAGTTHGAFDPSVGPLVARWGFGPIEGTPGGWRGLGAGDGMLEKAEDGLTLDLCGIAKGRALDRMAETLRAAGHDDFLIDLGGELTARGRHPTGRPWHAGIEDPRPGIAALAGAVTLDGTAIATSGTRANSYSAGDRLYSHIIDPAAREPITGALASVSVLAPTAMEADGWATALMAAGETRGPALATRHGIAALFLSATPDGLTATRTGGFDAAEL